MSEEFVQSTWVCPSCQAVNDNQNTFCKNCGFNASAQPVAKNNLKWIILVVAIILIAVCSYIGFSIYKKAQDTKKTKAYLQSQQVAFGDAVKSINGLGSEIDFSKKYKDEKNLDLVVQKMNDEKYKTSQAADVVAKSKASQLAATSTQETEGLRFLMTSFYGDAATLSTKYATFIAFQYDEAKMNADLGREQEKFQQQFKAEFQSDADVIAYFEGLTAFCDKIVAAYDGLNVPEGMEDYKQPVNNLKDLSAKLKDFTAALKKQDFKTADAIYNDIKSFDSVITVATQKSEEISYNYYSQLHDEFVSLRAKADKIKSELMLLDAKTQVQALDFSIEGW